MVKYPDRKIVIINQSVNYLTVDICNAFAKEFGSVNLISGFINEHERPLDPKVGVTYINKMVSNPFKKKLLSYLKASIKIFWLLKTRYRKYEVLFIGLVPPMGYLVNILVSNRTSILIWDVFPDALKITGIKESNLIYKFWVKLNKWSFMKSFKFYTVSETMTKLLSKYIDRDKIIVIPLWSVFTTNSKIEKSNNIFIKEHGLNDKFIVQYSGNIGLAHKVEVVVKLAEMLKDEEHIFFQIIGRGTRVNELKNIVHKKKLYNCQFLPFQTNDMFQYSLSAADLAVVILDDVASLGSVPSKSYNIMSFGIPSLYISSKESELYKYALKYRNGECFNINELNKAADFIKELSIDNKKQEFYSTKALKSSKNFKYINAEKMVEYYLK